MKQFFLIIAVIFMGCASTPKTSATKSAVPFIALDLGELNVLIVESYPRWEYRFLRNALMRDPSVNVSVLLLHPELAPGAGRNYIRKFPDTREQLAKFDVVFLGDVGIGENELTGEQCDRLRDLVDQQRSGLVFMPGQRGRQLTFLNHPLGELIPVAYDRTKHAGNWTRSEANFKLTSTGKWHFLTMLAQDKSRNEKTWKKLPGFFWSAGVERTRPGSKVLATHSSMRNASGYVPVLATRPWGSGHVLFVGTDATWRWRRGVEDLYHYRFWAQVIRWMAHKRKLAQSGGVRLTTYTPEHPRVGDEIIMHAHLLYSLDNTIVQTLRANVKGPDGKTRDLKFTLVQNGWGQYSGKMLVTEGGTYEVSIYHPKSKQAVKTKILVK